MGEAGYPIPIHVQAKNTKSGLRQSHGHFFLPGMILEKRLLNRLNVYLDLTLQEVSVGFRNDRGTINRIYTYILCPSTPQKLATQLVVMDTGKTVNHVHSSDVAIS